MMAMQQQDCYPMQRQLARLQLQLQRQRSPTVLSCKEPWKKLRASSRSYLAWKQQ
jgi:hypothetical protein